MTRTAAILSIGDELLAGAHPDLNAPVLAKTLRDHGVHTGEVHVVGDDEEPLAKLFAECAARHDVVISSGGLGPTLDDVTRHAFARAAGVELELDRAVVEHLRGWFAERGREMPSTNERQALFPAGTRPIPNGAGTAPGIHGTIGDATVMSLPGPPRELHAMLAAEVLPRLAEDGILAERSREESFHLIGLSESQLAEDSGDWMDRDADPLMGVTAKGGVLSVRMRTRGAPREEADRRLAERAAAFRERFGDYVFSEDVPLVEHALGPLLIQGGVSIAFAESCTAGYVCARLARVAGISSVLAESFVTYSNEAKTRRLGVDPALLERFGAVSSEVAEAMVRGAAREAGADLAVSVTGIAGPDGGTDEKPVGLVWYGVAFRGEVETHERRFPAVGREGVREFASNAALDLARRALVRAGIASTT